MGRRSTLQWIPLLLIGALVGGCAAKRPYDLEWERRKLHSVLGSGLRSSLQAASPILIERGNKLIIGTRGGALLTLGTKYGDRIQRVDVGKNMEAAPALLGSALVVATLDGTVRAYELSNWQQLWNVNLNDEILTQPLTNEGDNLIYITTNNNRLLALDGSTGAIVWRYRAVTSAEITLRGNARPVLIGDKVIAGFANGELVAFDAKRGSQLWKRQVSLTSKLADVDSRATLSADSKTVIVSSVGAPAAAYSIEGEQLWVNDKIASRAAGQIVDGVVYLPAFDGKLYALEARKGGVNWSLQLQASSSNSLAPSRPIIQNGSAVIGWSNGEIDVVDLKSRKVVWRYKIGGRLSGELVPTPEGFLAYNNSETLFHFVRRGGIQR